MKFVPEVRLATRLESKVLSVGAAAIAGVAIALMYWAQQPTAEAESRAFEVEAGSPISTVSVKLPTVSVAPQEAPSQSYTELDRAVAENDCAAVLAALEDLQQSASGGVPGWRKQDIQTMLACVWAVESDDSAERFLLAALQLDPTNVESFPIQV